MTLLFNSDFNSSISFSFFLFSFSLSSASCANFYDFSESIFIYFNNPSTCFPSDLSMLSRTSIKWELATVLGVAKNKTGLISLFKHSVLSLSTFFGSMGNCPCTKNVALYSTHGKYAHKLNSINLCAFPTGKLNTLATRTGCWALFHYSSAIIIRSKWRLFT